MFYTPCSCAPFPGVWQLQVGPGENGQTDNVRQPGGNQGVTSSGGKAKYGPIRQGTSGKPGRTGSWLCSTPENRYPHKPDCPPVKQISFLPGPRFMRNRGPPRRFTPSKAGGRIPPCCYAHTGKRKTGKSSGPIGRQHPGHCSGESLYRPA